MAVEDQKTTLNFSDEKTAEVTDPVTVTVKEHPPNSKTELGQRLENVADFLGGKHNTTVRSAEEEAQQPSGPLAAKGTIEGEVERAVRAKLPPTAKIPLPDVGGSASNARPTKNAPPNDEHRMSETQGDVPVSIQREADLRSKEGITKLRAGKSD